MADTKKVIICPACGELMSKIYMPKENLDLDFCVNGCGGIFFDGKELEQFDEPTDNAVELLELAVSKFYKKVDDSIDRICPACGERMVKNKASDIDPIIDTCLSCGAKFLDNGEFKKIRDYKLFSSNS